MAISKRSLIRSVAVAVSAVTLITASACGSSDNAASTGVTSSTEITQQTVKPGKLTIATGDPAYEPWVMNDKPESGNGYEAAVAYAVAKKMGFKKSDVIWTRTTFDSAIAPGAKDWDMNIQQFGITEERKKAVDFTSSYYNDSQAVIVKKDGKYANAKSLSDLKNATIGAMVGTEGYKYAKHIKDDVQTFNDDAAVAQAFNAGQIDALVTSTVECVYMVQSDEVKDGVVAGRIAGSTSANGMGIVLPKGSKLTAAATKAVKELDADGTLKSLQDKWLAEYTTDLKELK
jgi:polar amino acid transport system substrate-binding protein